MGYSLPLVSGEYCFLYRGHIFLELLLVGEALLDVLAAVNHCRIVARQACADCGKRHLGIFLGHVHHHLTRVRHLALAGLGKQQV